jgi:hypothetical protein
MKRALSIFFSLLTLDGKKQNSLIDVMLTKDAAGGLMEFLLIDSLI